MAPPLPLTPPSLAAPAILAIPTPQTALYLGSAGAPLNQTLEGALLARWPSGRPRFDAIHFESLPFAGYVAAGNASFSYTLLLNQSAIAGLPAALAAANSALLRMLVAARGGGEAGGSGGGGGAVRSGGASDAVGSSGGRSARGGEEAAPPRARRMLGSRPGRTAHSAQAGGGAGDADPCNPGGGAASGCGSGGGGGGGAADGVQGPAGQGGAGQLPTISVTSLPLPLQVRQQSRQHERRTAPRALPVVRVLRSFSHTLALLGRCCTGGALRRARKTQR